MKLDYDLIKVILEYVESKSDGVKNYSYESDEDLKEMETLGDRQVNVDESGQWQ